ncbi:MAG TPA: hypothetical protein VF221_05320 [Chloroflexota bacterium]
MNIEEQRRRRDWARRAIWVACGLLIGLTVQPFQSGVMILAALALLGAVLLLDRTVLMTGLNRTFGLPAWDRPGWREFWR